MPRRVLKPAQPAPARQPEPPPLERLSEVQLATRALYRRAERARKDLTEFCALVMRDEITRKPIVPAPHQKLLFSFVMAHDRGVVRLPIGTAKTTSTITLALWLLGNDVTQRGGMVSRTRAVAAKPLKQLADYISDPQLSTRLALVFPELQPSTRPSDLWNQSQISVERPAGIRDPSVVAAGVETKVPGSRWSWFVADDTIDDENTNTPEQREKCNSIFDARFVSRLDPHGSRAYVTNTPWDREDLTYHLELEAGWPTLSMDIYGDVWFSNVDSAWLEEALEVHLRPSNLKEGRYRLRAHDPDPHEETPLWPARYSAKRIEEIRHGKDGKGGMLPREFARMMLCEPFAAGSARCQKAWVEACKLRGVGKTLVSRYDGPHPTFCGVDLGIGQREKRSAAGMASDLTTFFVFALHPDKSREVLQVEGGRWSGKEIVDKFADYYERYRCVFALESNFGQDFIRQWVLENRRDIQITPQTTGAVNKHHLTFGVESIFAELQQELWIIPSEHGTGKVHPAVQLWIDEMIYYQPPPAHTGDFLMASWVARERCREAIGGGPKMQRRSKIQMAQAAGGF